MCKLSDVHIPVAKLSPFQTCEKFSTLAPLDQNALLYAGLHSKKGSSVHRQHEGIQSHMCLYIYICMGTCNLYRPGDTRHAIIARYDADIIIKYLSGCMSLEEEE